MRLKITHRTEYRYDHPIAYGLQRVRLLPRSGPTQAILSWSLAIEGAKEELRFVDHFGNATCLTSTEGEPRIVSIVASGLVETIDRTGVTGPHTGLEPLWLYEHETSLTTPGERVAALVTGIAEDNEIARLHMLMERVGAQVAYQTGATDPTTTAEQALERGAGVCQDHAHVFISAARRMGFPARYVSGYLMLDAGGEQAASHAWAEVHVPGLGWVAFDCSNAISPDDRYVKLAVGRDFRDATPVSGIRLGQGDERLAVSITVEQ